MIKRATSKLVSLIKITLIKLTNGNRLSMGSHFSMRKVLIVRIKKTGSVQIGNNVFFNSYCSVNCMERICIGNDCIFGEGVRIYDHNHCYKDSTLPVYKQGYKSSPVTIGNNCWVGSNVVILPGVTIGDNCVIGAGSVIYKSIPTNSLVKTVQDQVITPIERGE